MQLLEQRLKHGSVQPEDLGGVISEVDRMDGLLNDLLAFKEKKQVVLSEQNLLPLIENCVHLVVDIRLIAATSRNLEQAVEEGEFREDLYYRLNVVTIQLPPLRERRQDIPALVQHFLNRGARKASITPQALAMLDEHHWPGNVRELENTIERALVLAREGVVTKAEIELRAPPEKHGAGWADRVPVEIGWQANISELEKSLIERALRQAQGKKSKAAELLGIHRRLLYEKMRAYGIE